MLSFLESISTLNLALLVFTIVCIGLLVFLWYRKDSGARRIKKILKKISFDYIEDIAMDMGVDNFAHFDYLLVNNSGILAFEVKDFPGHIFCSEKINEWTQVINRKSYKFDNPFFDLERKIDLLKEYYGKMDITGLVIFTDTANFPKGRPDNVLKLGELQDFFKNSINQDFNETIRTSWNRVRAGLLQSAENPDLKQGRDIT